MPICVFSQDFMQHSQATKTQRLVNPAFNSSLGQFSAIVHYRNQWIGIDGAPVTKAINAFYSNSGMGGLGIGLSYIDYEYMFFKDKDFFMSLCYQFDIDKDNRRIAFGIQGGLNTHRFDPKKIVSNGGVLPPELLDDELYKYPNVGFGAYYWSKQAFLGFAIPKVMYQYTDSVEVRSGFDISKVSTYTYSGLNIGLNENIQFQPSVLLQYEMQEPYQLSIFANFEFQKTITVGMGWRKDEALIFCLDLKLPYIVIGYSYDYGISKLSKVSNGTHEVIIMYQFTSPKTRNMPSPRYF